MDVADAIAAGERNKAVAELVHNWCRHARVEKSGGTGLVEMQTGLPIGHHYLACDHAPAGGLATWDLTDAALSFYDRNCSNCKLRAPVGLPNISTLVQRRDAARERADRERDEVQRQLADRRAARREVRAALRAQLPTVSATIIDCIGDLDQDHSGDAESRLMGLAQLAPETFTSQVVEYLFRQLEQREAWFDDIGLRLLAELKAEPRRLVSCALRSLAEHRSVSTAAAILEENTHLIDDALLPDAVPALANLAHPMSSLFTMGIRREFVPDPLLAIHRSHAELTARTIGKLFDEHDPLQVSAGARGIRVLAEQDPSIATRFTRSVAAKLAGAKWLLDTSGAGYRGEDEVIHELQQALALALRQLPHETDALVAQFLIGAPSEGEVRLYRGYRDALHDSRRLRDCGGPPPADAVAEVVLKRLLDAATSATNYEVLQEVTSALSHLPEELFGVARKMLSPLLGTAILLDDKVERSDADARSDADTLAQLQRQNRRMLLVNLQNELIQWSAGAAAGETSATEQYIEILTGIPESRHRVRSSFIENAHTLAVTPAGLNAILPVLYGAMVGTSTLIRSAAATAIGKLSRRRRDDVPPLLYEAFVVLLSDPYVIVHKAAVDALDHLELAGDLDRRAKNAVGALLQAYGVSRSDDRFLLECIDLYLGRYATDAQKRGGLGKFVVALIERMKPDVIVEKLPWLQRDLCETEGFAGIVVRLLKHHEVLYRLEDIVRSLSDLPVSAIQQHKAELEAIASATVAERTLPACIVESLTRAGAWSEAARINEAVYARIADTTEKRYQKLRANLNRIATRYEEAIFQTNLDALPGLATQWRETERQIEDDRAQHEQRRRPFPDFPGTD